MHSLPQLFNLALQYHQSGSLPQAESLCRQILQIDPLHVQALHMIGVIALQAGNYDLAVEHIQQAIRLHPAYPEAHNNLGLALRALGKLPEALTSFKQAVVLKPDFAEAHYNCGTVLKAQARLQEAVASYRQALRLKPDYVPAYNSLGNALTDQGNFEEAIANYRQALRLKPDYFQAYNNLGNILTDQGKLEEAIASYRQVLRLKPNLAEAYNNLGNALMGQGKLDESLANYQQALRLKPDFHTARVNLGAALQQLSDLAGAEQAFRAALRENPRHVEALWQLSRLLGGKLPEADRALLERRLAEPDLNDSERSKLLFGLAEVCDAQAEYEKAAALLRQANALMLALRHRKGQGYNLDDSARFVENLMKVFTPAFFERLRGFGLDTLRPVFIVGLPRSGTTLTEQILAAHSQVFGAGELFLAREDFLAIGSPPATDQSIFATLPELPGEALRRLAQRHLDQLLAMNPTAARVVDKMPENYFYLGLLAALFPKAKFIHCRRDLRDLAVSCWMTHFDRLRWTNDAEHIVARFGEYQRLMEHWRAVLPVTLLEIQYEETVADLPGVARRLVEWCGLDWEPACLAFHESKKPVRTASVIQVRQPIHTKSVARWRHYERDLGPLLAALGPLLGN